MTTLSDTLTVGLVLVLLFGSIALYLYTRVQQAEQKISLLESILLDLKMSSEIKSYTELPADEIDLKSEKTKIENSYAPFDDDEKAENDNELENETKSTNSYPEIVSNQITSSPSGSIIEKYDEMSNEVEQYKSIIADAVTNNNDSLPKASNISVNYESMTIKELQTLAKSRGISGASSMKKGSIIEALKTSDRSPPLSSESGSVSTNSFLETSGPFLAENES